MAISINSGVVAYPTSFKKIMEYMGVSLWEPIAPHGYVALGFIAVPGYDDEPVQTACVCVHRHYIVQSALGEYTQIQGNHHLWSIENAGFTFIAVPPKDNTTTTTTGREPSQLSKLI